MYYMYILILYSIIPYYHYSLLLMGRARARPRPRPRPMCGGSGAVRPRGQGGVRPGGPVERAQHTGRGLARPMRGLGKLVGNILIPVGYTIIINNNQYDSLLVFPIGIPYWLLVFPIGYWLFPPPPKAYLRAVRRRMPNTRLPSESKTTPVGSW